MRILGRAEEGVRVGASGGAAQQARVDAGVTGGAGLGAGERGGEQAPLAGEERLAAEEGQLHRRRPLTGREQMLGEPAQGGGSAGQDLRGEVTQGRNRRCATGEPVTELGRPGPVVVTSLFRGLTRVIRYPAGDRAEWTSHGAPGWGRWVRLLEVGVVRGVGGG
ncbi:hypothetical protein ACH44C_00110 [Streptomyces purpureus]|uniref:hypothetical protein n=1 Tax=Streptomyces purpureus TaxID=1951 RepID=UPI0003758650|nr:hypothetical protein [Streptomyces purpureus]